MGYQGDRGLRGAVGSGNDFRRGGRDPSTGRAPAPHLSTRRAPLRLVALLVAILAGTFLWSCGGAGSDSSAPTVKTGGQSADRPSPTVTDDIFTQQAEDVCRRSLGEARALGRKLPRILASSSFPQEAITSGLVKPGVEILSGEASRLRGIGIPESRALQIFVGLFEPIVELGRQRLDVGVREVERAHSLERLIAGLESEQSAIARRSGLKACGISFNRALGQSG